MGAGASSQIGGLPPALPPKPGVSHLRHCATLAAHCVTDGVDVDVTRFLVSGSAIVNFIRSLGGFAHAAANDLHKRLTSIFLSAPEGTASMRTVLELEQVRGVHHDAEIDHGSKFGVGSAADGVFWVVLAMRYWEDICRVRVSLIGEADPPSLKDTLVSAHERLLRENQNPPKRNLLRSNGDLCL
jgi:hypothetical protein